MAHQKATNHLARTGPAALWERLGAALYDPFLARGERLGMSARRASLLSEARGRVLEIGAGTGLNLVHYPVTVEELTKRLATPTPIILSVDSNPIDPYHTQLYDEETLTVIPPLEVPMAPIAPPGSPAE